MGMKHISPAAVAQYQLEERSLIALRAKSSRGRLSSLLKCMINDSISFPQKISRLKDELAHHHRNNKFLSCKNMGEIVLTNIDLVLQKEFKQSIIDISE